MAFREKRFIEPFEQVGEGEDLRQSVFMAKTGGGRMPRSAKQLWFLTVFPTLALTAAFLLMLPMGMIVESAAGHHKDFAVVATALPSGGIGWLVVPGAVPFAGGVVANILFFRRPSLSGTAVG